MSVYVPLLKGHALAVASEDSKAIPATVKVENGFFDICISTLFCQKYNPDPAKLTHKLQHGA